METTRRSFFAWLAAPIVARFAPKPLPVSGVALSHAWRDNGHLFYSMDFSRARELFAECDAHYARIRQEMWSDRRFVDCVYPDGTRKRVEINTHL